MLSKQQVFDKVAEHLLTQREKAVRPNGDCAYRSPDGLKCAVGCLIPDDRYTPDLEGQGADWVPVLDALDGITNDRALLFSPSPSPRSEPDDRFIFLSQPATAQRGRISGGAQPAILPTGSDGRFRATV